MKRVDLKSCSDELSRLCDQAQDENIVLVRDGKPLATLMGLLNKDDEDLELQASQSFWNMIRRSRRGTSAVPLAEFKKELATREKNGHGVKATSLSRKKSATQKRGRHAAKTIQR